MKSKEQLNPSSKENREDMEINGIVPIRPLAIRGYFDSVEIYAYGEPFLSNIIQGGSKSCFASSGILAVAKEVVVENQKIPHHLEVVATRDVLARRLELLDILLLDYLKRIVEASRPAFFPFEKGIREKSLGKKVYWGEMVLTVPDDDWDFETNFWVLLGARQIGKSIRSRLDYTRVINDSDLKHFCRGTPIVRESRLKGDFWNGLVAFLQEQFLNQKKNLKIL